MIFEEEIGLKYDTEMFLVVFSLNKTLREQKWRMDRLVSFATLIETIGLPTTEYNQQNF